MVVSEHRPEAQQGASRNRDAELGKVTLEVRVDELLAPDVARLLRPGEIGERLSALAPQLVQAESMERDDLQPSGQRLRGLSEKIGRGTAEDQEACSGRPPVGQDAQDWEEVGPALDLVDDNHPA